MNKETIGRSIIGACAKPIKLIKENPRSACALGIGEFTLALGILYLIKGHLALGILDISAGGLVNVTTAASQVAAHRKSSAHENTITEVPQPKL